MKRLALLAAVILVPGCTFQKGTWFAEIEPTFAPEWLIDPARNTASGDGWQLLSTGYEIRVDVAEVNFHGIELVAHGEVTVVEDDHGHDHGHEHGEEEAEEEGGAEETVVVELPIGPSDLIIDARRDLECEPRCGLPLADIEEAHVEVLTVLFQGEVADTQVPSRIPGGGAVAFVLGAAIPEEHSVIVTEIDLPSDRSHAPDVDLDFTVRGGAALFDGIEVSAAVTTSAEGADFSTGEAFELFLENLEAVDIITTVSR